MDRFQVWQAPPSAAGSGGLVEAQKAAAGALPQQV